MARWGVDALRFRLRGSTDEATEKLLAEIKEVFRGTSARDISRLAPEVLVGVLPRIYPEMLEEVYAHQDAGRPTFIVSAAGDELVQLLARILYMDGGIGTTYEIGEDGRFTGELGGAVHVRGGEGRGDAQVRRRRTTSTSPTPRPTPTRPRTCRCCARSATRSSSTPTTTCCGSPASEGWRVMRFEKLGRRLAFAAFTVLIAAAGLVGRHRIGPWTGQNSRSRASRAKRT